MTRSSHATVLAYSSPGRPASRLYAAQTPSTTVSPPELVGREAVPIPQSGVVTVAAVSAFYPRTAVSMAVEAVRSAIRLS